MLSELDATAPEVETEFSNLYPSPLLSQEDRQAPVQIPANSLGAAFFACLPTPWPFLSPGSYSALLLAPWSSLHRKNSDERSKAQHRRQGDFITEEREVSMANG